MTPDTRRRHALLGAITGIAALVSTAAADYTPGTLKAWWPMNEGAGTAVADQSGFDSNGVMTVVAGQPRFQDISGAFGGRALSFSRNANDAAWFRSNLFNISDRGTLSVRVRITSWWTRNQIMEGPGNDNFLFQYRFQLFSRRWNARVAQVDTANGENPETSNAPTVYSGTWHTIQYTWDKTGATSGVVRIYFNGTEYSYGSGTVGNSAITNWAQSAVTQDGMMWIGRDPGTLGNSFNGALDEFAIYTQVLTQTQRNTIRNSGVAALASPAPLVHYPFNEATGETVASDSSANGIHLNLRRPGVPLWDIVPPPNAAVGESLAFMNDYAAVTANAAMDDGLNFPKRRGTVVFWVRRESWSATADSNVARQAVLNDSTGAFSIEFGGNGAQGNRLYFTPNAQNSANNFFMLDTPMNDREWHHVAFTFDLDEAASSDPAAPARINGWLNGTAQGNFVTTNDPDVQWTSEAVTGAQWRLGRRFDGSRPLDGYLADMAMFSEVLTEGDINFIKDNGVAAFISQTDAPPVVDLNGAAPGINNSVTFNFGTGPVALSPSGNLTDADSTDLTGLTVTLTNLQDAGSETLTADTTGTSIVADFTGNVLTLSGMDTVTNYQQVLRTVSYEHVLIPPTGTTRTATFLATDGVNNSQMATALITFAGIPNVPPVVDLNGPGPGNVSSLNYVIGNGPQEFSPQATIADADSNDIHSMTVTLINPQNGANEVLGYLLDDTDLVGTGGPTSVTISGIASPADYELVLRTMTYNNTAGTPTPLPARRVNVTVHDGTDPSETVSANINLTNPSNLPPVVDLNGPGDGFNGSAVWIEGDGPVVLAPVAVVTDGDSANLAFMSLTIVNNPDPATEVLDANTSGTSITASYADGELLLTGPASLAHFQQVLRTVTLDNSSLNPDDRDREIAVVAHDGFGPSTTRNISVIIIPVDDPGTVDLNGAGTGFDHDVVFTEGDSPVNIAAADATLLDPDSPTVDEMLVVLENRLDSRLEVLDADVSGTSISLSFARMGSETGELSLTGPDSIENFQQVLRTITYENSSQNPTEGDRTITVMALTGGEPTNTAIATVSVFSLNSPPVVTTNGGLFVLRGGSGVINATRLTVVDPDNTEDEIEFTVTANTLNGTLTMTNFTMEDVRNGKLVYTHSGTMTIADSFTFEATDPGMLSTGPQTFDITISTDAASTEASWLLYD